METEEINEMKEIPQIKLNHQPSGGREWVAEIKARCKKYGFEREFLVYGETNWSSSGKTGSTTFFLERDGIYEYNEPFGVRGFVEVQNGKKKSISAEEVRQKI